MISLQWDFIISHWSLFHRT